MIRELIEKMEQDRANLDTAIQVVTRYRDVLATVLRPPIEHVVEPKRLAAPKAVAKKVEPKKKKSPYDWTRALDLWKQGSSVPAIAKQIGCTAAAVDYHRHVDKWPAPRLQSSSAPLAKVGKSLPTRTCGNCGTGTAAGRPCAICGET